MIYDKLDNLETYAAISERLTKGLQLLRERDLSALEPGRYEVDDDVKAKISELFWAGCCDDEQTQATIREIFESRQYLADTHTAVALNVYEQYVKEFGSEVPTIIASTASPYKFAPAVLGAISKERRVRSGDTRAACRSQG